MGKKSEQFEEILDELHENKKACESLKSELNTFKEEVLKVLPGDTSVSSPQQETSHVKVEYGDLKDAVYDGMANYYAAFPTAAGDLTENEGKELAQICEREYNNSFVKLFKEREETDKTQEEELHKRRKIQGVDTIEQVAEWAPEYSPEVQRVMRFIGLNIIDADEPVETAHTIMKIWGNAVSRVTNAPDTPPTLKAWSRYRWSKAKAYTHKKQKLAYYALYLLVTFAIGSLALYQHKVMRMDETNHVWYKTVIQTREDADKWNELDSILHKDSSFYDRLYDIH